MIDIKNTECNDETIISNKGWGRHTESCISMFDYITVACLVGLVVFWVLWKKVSLKVWYMDSDNAPVSLKAVVELLWMVWPGYINLSTTLLYQSINCYQREQGGIKEVIRTEILLIEINHTCNFQK